MKKLIVPFLALGMIIGASSCSKCVTCKKNDQWEKFCDKDYTKQDVSDAIDTYELLGWDCKSSSQMF